MSLTSRQTLALAALATGVGQPWHAQAFDQPRLLYGDRDCHGPCTPGAAQKQARRAFVERPVVGGPAPA